MKVQLNRQGCVSYNKNHNVKIRIKNKLTVTATHEKMLSVELANQYQPTSVMLTKCYIESQSVIATTSCPVTK